jgi:hypothetical protein
MIMIVAQGMGSEEEMNARCGPESSGALQLVACVLSPAEPCSEGKGWQTWEEVDLGILLEPGGQGCGVHDWV